MITLLHASDPHFGTERPQVVAGLRLLSEQVAPDVVVLSGDVTQRARRAQFRRARAFLDDLGAARHIVVPGNHDLPLFDVFTRFAHPYREYRRAFGEEVEPVLDIDDLLALGVNTTRPARHKDGEVSAAQVERMADRLRRARPNQLRVVVVHQPIAVMRVEDEHDRLHGAEHAVRSWAGAGADVILGGHIHLPYVLPLHERMHGLGRRIWAVQAGTAVSDRTRAEADNSVNVLRYAPAAGERRVVVERWDWRPAAGRFEQAKVDALELDRAPQGRAV